MFQIEDDEDSETSTENYKEVIEEYADNLAELIDEKYPEGLRERDAVKIDIDPKEVEAALMSRKSKEKLGRELSKRVSKRLPYLPRNLEIKVEPEMLAKALESPNKVCLIFTVWKLRNFSVT